MNRAEDMDTHSESFADVFHALSTGDQEAARQIYERYVERMMHLAARRLNRSLGARADPETVAHSAFESFFAGQQRGRYQLHSWADVLALLSHITLRKCLQRNRYYRQQKRNGPAAVSLEDWQVVAREPSPEEQAEVAELFRKSIENFDADERAVIEAYLHTSTINDVAQQVGFSERTVHRILSRFRARLDELLHDEEEAPPGGT
jgi:RNA polymerase sigma factor (sigma-70 family)